MIHEDDSLDFGCSLHPLPEALHNAVPGFDAVCRRWALIALGALGGAQQVLRTSNCINPSLLSGLGIRTVGDDGLYDRVRAEAAIQVAMQESLEMEANWPKDSPLLSNIQCLTKMLGLNRAEEAVLTLVVLERQDTLLSQALETLGALNNSRLYDSLCQLLRLPEKEIRMALSPGSRLFRTSLLRLDPRIYAFEHKIDLIAGLSEKMIHVHTQPYAMFSNNFIPARESSLTFSDYDYLNDDARYLKDYLSEVIRRRTSGVNILIYGPPGTGKTELTRALSQELGAIQFEIATETEDGSRLSGIDRLASYQLSQHVLAHAEQICLMFDEVEDVFSMGSSGELAGAGQRTNASGQKAWMNKLLEENPVPAFWLTNSISEIDPAHLRRFSFHLQLKIPPRSIRERIFSRYAEPLGLGQDCVRRIAANEALSPAVLANSSAVARAIQSSDSRVDMEQVVNRLLANTMRALGDESAPDGVSAHQLPYDPNSLNAGHDLSKLVKGVLATGSARLCLYGPPGSGKTAFAHHLAEKLDRPILVRRASDILGSLVGQTERNIAAAFGLARDEGAVLLLDEADSFLMDRRGAQRPWEISSVNEMLTSMESFDGVFIASTNLLDQLDAASLRRFDAKILFDYLRPEQALRFFHRACEKLGFAHDQVAEAKVKELGMLTPGDFAALMRQSRLVPIEDANELARRLGEECALKPNGRRAKIGF